MYFTVFVHLSLLVLQRCPSFMTSYVAFHSYMQVKIKVCECELGVPVLVTLNFDVQVCKIHSH